MPRPPAIVGRLAKAPLKKKHVSKRRVSVMDRTKLLDMQQRQKTVNQFVKEQEEKTSKMEAFQEYYGHVDIQINDKQYFSQDCVEGVVYLDLKQDISTQDIYVILIGKVFYQNQAKEAEMFKFMNHAFQIGSVEGGFKAEKVYIFPFKIQLPSHLPRSIQIIRRSLSVVCEYKLKASIIIQNDKIDSIRNQMILNQTNYKVIEQMKQTFYLTKHVKFDVLKKPPQQQTQKICTEFNSSVKIPKGMTCIGGYKESVLKIHLKLNKSLYHLDETIKGVIIIDKSNDYKIENIQSLEISLYRVIFVNLPNLVNKQIKQQVVKQELVINKQLLTVQEQQYLVEFSMPLYFKTIIGSSNNLFTRINHFIQIVPKKMKNIKVAKGTETTKINYPVDIYKEQEISSFLKCETTKNIEKVVQKYKEWMKDIGKTDDLEVFKNEEMIIMDYDQLIHLKNDDQSSKQGIFDIQNALHYEAVSDNEEIEEV